MKPATLSFDMYVFILKPIVRSRTKGREVAVLAPSYEAAQKGCGRMEDEHAIPLKLNPLDAKFRALFVPKRVGIKELGNYYLAMGKSLSAGASNQQALEMAANSVSNPFLKGIIGSLLIDVTRHGLSISASMTKFSDVFGEENITVINAGEAGGSLPKAFLDLHYKYMQTGRIAAKIRAALYYPGVILTITLVAMMFAQFKIFPGILAQFSKYAGELPPITKMMMDVTNFCAANPIVFGIPFLLMYGLYTAWPKIRANHAYQRSVINIPVFGSVLRAAILSRALRTLIVLLNAGITTIEALQITRKSAGNVVYANYFAAVLAGFKEGQNLEQAFMAAREYIGEKQGIELAQKIYLAKFSGNIGELLQALVTTLEEEANLKAEQLPKVIEPLTIVVISGLVGIMMVAIYLPTLELALQMTKSVK